MIVVALMAPAAVAQKIAWKTDYKAALKESAKSGKPVLVHFVGEG